MQGMNVEGYERLRFAIIKQAVMDYRTALRREDEAQIKYYERFFHSPWYSRYVV